MLCFSDIIAINYVSLLVLDRQEPADGTMKHPRSVKDCLILECCNSDRSVIS